MDIRSNMFVINTKIPWRKIYQEKVLVNNYSCVMQKWQQYDLEMRSVYFMVNDVSALSDSKIKALVRCELMNGRSGYMFVERTNDYVFVNFDICEIDSIH